MDPSGLSFIAQEVKSRRVLGDVNMTGFSCREKINGFGEWSGTLHLSEDAPFNPFELTEPWKVRLIAHRDGQVAAGLDVWTRDRSLGSTSVAIGGKFCGSWLQRVLIGGRNGGDLKYERVEQQAIARDLVSKAQAEWGDGGLEVSGATYGAEVYRDKNTWEASDGKPYGEALEDLVNLQNGFQFRFETYSPAPGQYAVRLLTGYPYVVDRAPIIAELTNDGTGQMAGNIRDLKLQESVAVLATDGVVWGSGEGNVRLRGRAENPSLANSIPRIARTENRLDVITQSWLDHRAATIVSQSTTAAYAPQLWLAADDPQHPFGSYATGDQVFVNVDPCLQFPYGLYGLWRIMEIEYNPAVHGSDVGLVIGDQQ